MRPLPTALLLLLLLVLLAAPLRAEDAPPAADAAAAVTGRFEVRDGQPVLTLWGSPRERGYAHGYLLAEQILDGVEHDFAYIMKPFLGLYDTLVRNVVVPRFAFSASEQQELEGLVAGVRARVPKERMVLSALGRELDLRDLKALNTFGDWYGLGCSSLAVWGELTADGQPLVGRNFDFPAFDLVLRHQYVVVRAAGPAVAPEGAARGLVGVSYPGCIGLMTGMNDDGVFVSIHDVHVKPTLEKALRPNVPRLQAVRRLLERVGGPEACTQARDLARTWPTLYGNNLMVVGSSRVPGTPCAGVLEYDCRVDQDGGCTLRLAEPTVDEGQPAACLACTNHHRSRESPPPDPTVEVKPRWRYPLLCSAGAAAKPQSPFTVARLFDWMAKASFPRDGTPQKRAEAMRGKTRHHGTLHQVVAETAPARLHVKLGAVGRNIRSIEARTYDIPRLLQAVLAAGRPQAPAQPAGQGVR